MSQNNTKKRVGILRGGSGENYRSSLKKGGDIILYLHENLLDKYKTVDILIDKMGVWHINGLPAKPTDLVNKIDMVWNMAHPGASMILEDLSIPNIAASSFSHTLENSRDMLRENMKKIGVQMPRRIILPLYQKDFDGRRDKYAVKKAMEVFEKFPSPWVVKSLASDSNTAIHLAKTFPELVDAISEGVTKEKSIIIEEFIPGKVVSVHSLPGFRDEKIYIFPPVNVFGNFTQEEKEKLISLAKDLHNHLGAEHYLKSNFVLNKRGKVYLLDFESTPNLKSFSHFSQACESVGAKMNHVIEHILEGAL